MKRFMLVSIIMSMLTGCAGLETAPPTDGTVTGNIFQLSSVPFTKIKVDSAFHYVGATSNYRHHGDSEHATSTDSGTTTREEYYIFVDSDSGRVLRMIIVKFRRLHQRWMFATDLYKHSTVKIEGGRVTLGNTEYEYAISYVTISTTDPVDIFYSKKNLIAPQCSLAKRFGRVIGTNIAYEIFYLEDVSRYGLSCSDFKNLKLLPDKVRNYIPGFNERCSQAFQVID
jgi:hypothetical protein